LYKLVNMTEKQIKAEALQIYKKIGPKTKTGKVIIPFSEPFIGKYNRAYTKIYNQVKKVRSNK